MIYIMKYNLKLHQNKLIFKFIKFSIKKIKSL